MATAAELLADVLEVDKTLVVDNDFRIINIPSSVPNLGVEHDDDVLRLEFKMPRYVSNTDLSSFSIRINYINANGETDAYTVKSPVIGTQHITFDWLVGPTATRYKGNTSFNICAKTLKSGTDVIDREFNTTPATLPVLEGLEVDESIVTEYSDLIEQWKRELFGIGDTEEASIKTVSQNEQTAIENKGAEVLATIPAEYTETAEAAQEGIRTKADAIVCKAQDEIISVVDSSDDHVRGLKIFGKTTQISTTGKNLVNLPQVVNKPDSGYDYDLFTGTAGQAASVPSEQFDKLPYLTAGTYYLNAEFDSGAANTEIKVMAVADDGTTSTASILATKSGSFTVNTDGRVTIRVGTATAVTIKNIQIEAGDSYTGYEPYSAGVASPSPEWPQEMNNIENPTVSIYGKNLLKLVTSSQTTNGVTFTVNPDNSVSIKGTATASVYYGLNYDIKTLIPGKQYTMTGGLEGSSGTTYRLYAQTIDGKKFYADYGNGVSFTATDEQWQVLFTVYKDTTVDFTIYPALRLKSVSDATYEPYTDQPNVVLSRSLSGVPVTTGGNYTDANGQQWICDEIDFERGVYIQRTCEYVITGEERWAVSGIQSGIQDGFVRYDGTATTPGCRGNDSLWTHFPYKGTYIREWYGAWVHNANDSRIGVRIVTDQDSVDSLVSYLNALYTDGSPVKVRYVLATPIETALTAEEIAAFKALHTNYPNTTVLNDAGATMELKYNVDTKTYVENGIQRTVTEVMEAIENGSY